MTIRKKLIINFLFLSLASLTVTALLGYYSAKNALEEQVKEKMMAIADAREQHLLDFLDLNKKTITVFSADGFIVEKMELLQKGEGDREQIMSDLNYQLDFQNSLQPDYYELFVMDTQGIVVASTDRSKIGNDESYDDYFMEGKKGVYIKDAHLYERNGKKSLVFAYPIFHKTDPEHLLEGAPPHFVGVIAVRLETSHLDGIVGGTSHSEALTMSQGLGKTSEIYLVNKNGLMLTPSKFKEATFLKQKVDTLPVQKCLSERKEIIDIYPNYIGETVIGASMCIPSMNWALLTEIGVKEAFAPVILFRNRIIFISIIMAFLSILLALLVIRKISRPIKILTDTAQEIGKGNFDQKIRIKTDDEIGILAQEFNKMAANLEQRTKGLTESEKKFRDLFESSQDAIMTLNPPDWKFTSGNPATVKMFKAKDEKELISYEPWKLSPEKQPDGKASGEKAKEMIEKAMREGSNFFEWTHRRINGDEFPATVLLSRIKQDGNVFLQATVRDITEIKKAGEELRRFNKLAVDRELKMIELKKKIKDLEEKITPRQDSRQGEKNA